MRFCSRLKWQFKYNSKVRSRFGSFSLIGIDSDSGELNAVEPPFKPYLFIRDSDAVSFSFDGVESVEDVDLKTIEGHGVVKLNFDNPRDVGVFVRKNKDVIKIYEGDIPYARRVFIDKAFDVFYSKKDVVFLDVELDDSEGFKDYGLMKFLSYCVHDYGSGKTVFESVYDCGGDESKLLGNLYSLLDGKSVIVGWNVEFDYNHLVERRKYVPVYRKFNGLGIDLPYRYDLREEYRNFVKGLSGYSLDDVARYEGFGGKAEKKGGKVSNLSRQELKEYNIRDVELLLEINKRYGFIERDLSLCNEVSLPMDYVKSALLVGDCLVLRRLRELGYVAPNAVDRKKSGYSGAVVLEPVAGLHRNVGLFDVVSLYPTAVIVNKVDIHGFSGEVVPYIVAYFFKRKNEEEAKGNKVGREVFKILANSLYGLFGYEYFRFFDERKAEKITSAGREVLMKMKSIVESMGLKVLAGDTDSIFVACEGIEDASVLADLINEEIKPYQVKFETIFDKIIFFGREGKGVKKRYVGVTKDGKYKYRGIELRRGDWCELSKMVFKNVVDMIFEGKGKSDIMSYLNDIRKRLFAGELDDMLKLVKHINTGKKYETRQAHYVLWVQGTLKGIIPRGSNEVEYYYKYGGGLGFWNELNKVYDYKEYWNKQVMAPVKRILDSVFGKAGERLDVFV